MRFKVLTMCHSSICNHSYLAFAFLSSAIFITFCIFCLHKFCGHHATHTNNSVKGIILKRPEQNQSLAISLLFIGSSVGTILIENAFTYLFFAQRRDRWTEQAIAPYLYNREQPYIMCTLFKTKKFYLVETRKTTGH